MSYGISIVFSLVHVIRFLKEKSQSPPKLSPATSFQCWRPCINGTKWLFFFSYPYLPEIQGIYFFKSLSSYFVVVQLLSCVQLFVTPWTAAGQAPLSSTISWSLLKFMSSESVMLSNISPSAAPFFFCLKSFPASGTLPSVASSHQVAKHWSFSSRPSNEYTGLIFFRIDWFDILVVQGTLKSLLQHYN